MAHGLAFDARRSFLVVIAALCVGQATADESPLAHAVDRLVKKNGITADGPGVAILLVQPGKPVFKKGYGLARLRDQTPITPQTLFELASVSKTFTATATLLLHERGKLSVHDDVRKYLPELPKYDPAHPIKISDLLHHTSGLPDYLALDDVPSRHGDVLVNEDYAREFARQRQKFPLAFPTGQKYAYNNTNYMLLGLIIGRVAKKSYGQFMHDEIFLPAGMKSTFVYESPGAIPSGRAQSCAIGYEKDKKHWAEAWGVRPFREERHLEVGDGAIWTNLEDMQHWDAALREHKLIKKATMRMALEPSKTRDGQTNGYGFGWQVYTNDSGGMNGFGHEGSWGGFRTSYYQYVLASRTTVVLSNRGNFDPDKFWYALNDVVEQNQE
ncbi:MAG TPA: serine hydrolase domain-containing protein [Pirellulales bacterium]|jgi:CubicO group peptidase (beta-lactamase class C family)|nr:serine hydrolase domain-containing protein [Pirellulales bacterium]